MLFGFQDSKSPSSQDIQGLELVPYQISSKSVKRFWRYGDFSHFQNDGRSQSLDF